jgi:hypothetical protein
MNKEELLNFAKGIQPEPQYLWIIFERNEAGEVIVIDSFLLPKGLNHNIICTSCRNGGTNEFWKTFDEKPLIEATRRRLISENKNSFPVE